MLRYLALSAALLAGVAAQDHGNHGKGFLPPFTAIDVGFRGCMPLSVVVLSGTDYRFDVDGLTVRGRGLILSPRVCERRGDHFPNGS